MQGRTVLAAGVIACAGLVSGCSENGAPPAIVAYDSAGVQILEVNWDAAPVRWTADENPVWTVGDEAAEEFSFPLFQVRDVAWVHESRVAIAEGSTQEVVWVNLAEGSTARTGGQGEGPEEFQDLQTLSVEEAGRVGAFDAARRRLVVVDPAGGVVREESLPDVFAGRADPSLIRSKDGTRYVLNVAGVPPEWEEGWSRGDAPMVRLDPSPDTVLHVPGREVVMVSEPVGYEILSFGATTIATGARRGVWVGDTQEAEVELWEDSEAPQAIVRWSARPEEGPDRRARLLEARLSEVDEGFGRELLTAINTAVPDSLPLPAFQVLLTGPAGDLWIGRRDADGGGVVGEEESGYEWLVLDPDVHEVGRVRTAPGFRPVRVDDGRLLGVHTDTLGVESVRQYEFRSIDP